MKSVMTHQFSQVPRANIPRSKFDRSSGYKTTFNAGQLIPIYADEVLPADTINLSMNMFGRLNTPIFPFMDNVFLETFFFFVPNRLVWDNWQAFNGEQKAPNDSTDFLVPQITSDSVAGFPSMSMYDYMGIPTLVPNLKVNSLHMRAYNLIWNEWFRDQNLQAPVPVPTDDGPDSQADFVIKRRGKRHDYFTSALPWPQKGPAVELPLGQQAPVYREQQAPNFAAYTTAGPVTLLNPVTGLMDVPDGSRFKGSHGGLTGTPQITTAPSKQEVENTGNPNAQAFLYADLSDATASTINALREAFQIQKLYERDARGGTRYTEIIRSHFGVISPDARLQRPEYLGGSSTRVNVHPIAQTSESSTESPQGNLAAMGTVSDSSRPIMKSFTEHGVIIGLACVRADLTYQQGLDKMWSRRTRFDYYWPALSHLGEQVVKMGEILATGDPELDEKAFGYQERFAEYRYKTSKITGEFRSNFPQSLDQWHLCQDFASVGLDSNFIEENPPIDRVVAVPLAPHFIADFFFKSIEARPMPVYSVPGLIDHF